MTKKRLILLVSAALSVLLLVGLVGVTVVAAQEPTPEFPVPFGRSGDMDGGFGRRGGKHGMMGGFGDGGQWTMFDTAAEALGLTPEELFAELHAGAGLDEVAEAQGVEVEALQEAMQAARVEARSEAIEQAVEDGTISQEQADWMLEGLEQGFSSGGQGFRGHGFGRGTSGHDCFQDD
ncbi:MAG: hypothetical protein U9R15_08185 [Chloroflexota bacterium]|nr:hypothetical protein [Chloroflexota bacterium]